MKLNGVDVDQRLREKTVFLTLTEELIEGDDAWLLIAPTLPLLALEHKDNLQEPLHIYGLRNAHQAG